MQFDSGASLGHYEIVAPLGKGGMGEVYRARDTKLGREVALKILPEQFTADTDRLARFEREARVLASLDHPHVAAIHGFEHIDDVRFLVMQLAEGEDLSDRIRKGPIPLDEATEIAKQIAAALEVAHEQGIVHRDLKPANIKIDDEGNVRVLDFGLAKAFETEESDEDFANSPTMVRAATHAGVILGTAAYMSPEQARGKRVDKRADIWAFGVVLWEMLTGERLFEGDTVSDTLAAVLTRTPDLSKLPAGTRSSIRWVLERCLERNPKTRLRDIGEARIALEGTPPEAAGPASEPVTERSSRRATIIAAAIGLVLGALATLGIANFIGDREKAHIPSAVRFRIAPEGPGGISGHAVSPDGRSVAWSEGDIVWIRRLDQLEPRKIELPWTARVQSWTPDARSAIVHRRNGENGELWKLPLDGGPVSAIATLPKEGFLWGVSPGANDEILIGMADAGIYTVPASGGVPRRLVAPIDDEGLTGPFLAREGVILFANIDEGRIETEVNGERKIVLERPGDRIFDPAVAPSEHLIFRIDGGDSAHGIWAAPFSVDRLEVTGEPAQILPYGRVSVANDGTIAFREFVRSAVEAQLVEVDRSGDVVQTIGDPLPGLNSPALSPDGSLIAVAARTSDLTSDVFVLNRRTGARYQLADPVGSDWSPFWSDGGGTLGFLTWGSGIRRASERSADGTGEVRLLDDETLIAVESPDGRFLVTSFYETSFRERGSEEETVLFRDVLIGLRFSPDGRWIAYTPLQRDGLFLRRFPEADMLTPVASGDVDNPRFSPDGSELYFWEDGTLMAVSLALTEERAVVGKPQPLFPASLGPFDSGWWSFDVTEDGNLLMVKQLAEAEESSEEDPGIVVLQNWASELGR